MGGRRGSPVTAQEPAALRGGVGCPGPGQPPRSPLLPPQPPSLSPQASPGAALELGKMGDGDTSTPPGNSAAPQRRTLPPRPGSTGGAAASPIPCPCGVGMLVMGGGGCRAPGGLRDAQSKGGRARGVLMVQQRPPKLVSSRRCSCRLGQLLLLAPPWPSAAPHGCPGTLPSCSARVTQPVSPNRSLPAPSPWSFSWESPRDLKQHPQHKLALIPIPPHDSP